MIQDFLNFITPPKINENSIYNVPYNLKNNYQFPQNDPGYYALDNFKQLPLKRDDGKIYGIKDFDNQKFHKEKQENTKHIFDFMGIKTEKITHKTLPLIDPNTPFENSEHNLNLELVLNSLFKDESEIKFYEDYYNKNHKEDSFYEDLDYEDNDYSVLQKSTNKSEPYNNKNNEKKITLSSVENLTPNKIKKVSFNEAITDIEAITDNETNIQTNTKSKNNTPVKSALKPKQLDKEFSDLNSHQVMPLIIKIEPDKEHIESIEKNRTDRKNNEINIDNLSVEEYNIIMNKRSEEKII